MSRGSRTQLTCSRCGIEFSRPTNRVPPAGVGKVFCSNDCRHQRGSTKFAGGTKECGKCGVTKPVIEFYVRANGRPQSSCIECHRAYMRARHESDPYARRRDAAVRFYGITPEQFDEMMTWPCAICGMTTEEAERSHHLDHDHSTGLLRGVLCHGCNTGIGNLREDPAVLAKAISYLKRTAVTRDPER